MRQGGRSLAPPRVLDVVISGISKVREKGPELFSFPVRQEIVEGARYLLSRAPEDGALETPSLDCAKVFSRKWDRWGRQVAALSEALTLLRTASWFPTGKELWT